MLALYLGSRAYSPNPMRVAPTLPPVSPVVVRRGHAMLVNPFYAKDAHASYGKHVLTPALTMSSLAGATPAGWTLSFWD